MYPKQMLTPAQVQLLRYAHDWAACFCLKILLPDILRQRFLVAQASAVPLLPDVHWCCVLPSAALAQVR